MQIGAIFPQTEIGPDPAAIRDYVEAVESMEFDYLFIADHVLGADPTYHEHVRGSYYTHHSVIHESLTTLAFIAALTTSDPPDHRHPDPAPASDGPGGQAGRGD